MSLINFLQKMKQGLYRSLLQMNKYININNLKKHFKKGITPLLCALTVFNLVGINVNAASYHCYIPYVKPSVPDYGGYVLLNYTAHSDANTMLYLAFYPYDNNNGFSGSSPIQPYFEYISTSAQVTDSSVTLRVGAAQRNDSSYNVVGYIVLYRVYWDGEVRVLHSAYRDLIKDGPFVWTSNEFQDINAVNIVGNWTSIQNNLTEYNTLDVVWGDSNKFYELLNSSYSVLNSINSNTSLTYGKLQQIYDRLGVLLDKQSSESITDVSQSEINSVDSKEQSLVGSDVSTSDLNVSINPQASSVVWNLVDNAVTGNAKVFAMFISILTIGIIGLILNR